MFCQPPRSFLPERQNKVISFPFTYLAFVVFIIFLFCTSVLFSLLMEQLCFRSFQASCFNVICLHLPDYNILTNGGLQEMLNSLRLELQGAPMEKLLGKVTAAVLFGIPNIQSSIAAFRVKTGKIRGCYQVYM